MSGDPAWKQVERRVARFLGGERNPTSGGNGRHSRADALLPKPIFVETKHGKAAEALLRSPKRLARLFEQVEERAIAEGKVPVVVLHPPRWGNGGAANYPAFVRHEVCRPSAAVGTKGRPALLLPHEAIVSVPLSEVKAALVENR